MSDAHLNGQSFIDAVHAGLALERELQPRLFESDDAREGIGASLEKRKPDCDGR